ncbi:MAG: hypothetical protein JWP42_4216 [Pseudomonas sp.]|nr:hypothetical protein [Pseudomonas sp.]
MVKTVSAVSASRGLMIQSGVSESHPKDAGQLPTSLRSLGDNSGEAKSGRQSDVTLLIVPT